MNYDPRFAAVCGDARLPSYRTGRLIERKPPAVEKDPSGDLDAQRLRHFLASKLSNDYIIMVSNRQPFSHDVVNWRPKNNARYQRAVDLSLAVDRFDYTKGILEQLQAFEELMTNRPLARCGSICTSRCAYPHRFE